MAVKTPKLRVKKSLLYENIIDLQYSMPPDRCTGTAIYTYKTRGVHPGAYIYAQETVEEVHESLNGVNTRIVRALRRA